MLMNYKQAYCLLSVVLQAFMLLKINVKLIILATTELDARRLLLPFATFRYF